MNTTDQEIIDRYGKRVTRSNGVLQDGDFLRVKLTMLDASDPRLVAAAMLADAVKRNEQFDARNHRPGYATRDAASTASVEKVLADRDARLTDAWKTPPSVLVAGSDITPVEKVAIVGPAAGNEALFAARDKVISDRDRRTEEAWKA